jgi:hypothetical protein
MKKLRADLDRSVKERDELAVQLRGKSAAVAVEGARGEPFLNLRHGDGEASSRQGATEVARIPQASGRARSQKEIRALVERLLQVIDDYASPAASPSLLEPDLTALSMAAGRAAAEGVIDVYEHARRLLDHVDKNVLMNKQLRDALLSQAERMRAKLPPEEGSAYKKKTGAGVEDKQRELELREKAMKINEEQRRRLLALRDAVLASLKRLNDVEATHYLAARLENEPDAELRLKMVEALEATRARHAVPALLRKLASPDSALRSAVHRTLTVIAGVDLGEEWGPWQKWWEENKGASG